jgi:hypothetical protein
VSIRLGTNGRRFRSLDRVALTFIDPLRWDGVANGIDHGQRAGLSCFQPPATRWVARVLRGGARPGARAAEDVGLGALAVGDVAEHDYTVDLDVGGATVAVWAIHARLAGAMELVGAS